MMRFFLKVLTYNICHCMDYTNAKDSNFAREWWNIQPQKVAEVLRDINAQIVCLNEVFSAQSGVLKTQHRPQAY